MKRQIIIAAALVLMLCGCSSDPSKRDTMVYIPAEPEWVVEVTVSGGETEASQSAQPMTESATEAAGTATIKVVGSSSSSKNKQTTSGGGSAKITVTETTAATTKPAATEPAAMTPTETEPTEREPVETEPTETKSTETEPIEAKPTEPTPAETVPMATEPPAAEPTTMEPAATDPVSTQPPATEPPETEPPLYDISGYSVGALEYGILDRINEYRAEAELEELELDEWLCAIGSCRSYESSLVWSHTRPDGRGYATVLSDYGYSAGGVKELLVYVYGSGDGAAMVDKWMSSDSHRELLLGSFSTLGVGVYRANGFTYVACLLIP